MPRNQAVYKSSAPRRLHISQPHCGQLFRQRERKGVIMMQWIQALKNYPPPRILVLASVSLFMLWLAAAPALAADINVDSFCTLAQAINEANEETTDVGSCEAGADADPSAMPPTDGADKIILSGNAHVAAKLPDISSIVTIDGGGYQISQASSSHLYKGALLKTVAGSELTLEDVTLDSGGGGSPAEGALVLGDTATVTKVTFNGCYRFCVLGNKSGATFTLESVYFHAPFAGYFTPASIWAEAGTFTINKAGFRNIREGGDALIRVESGANVTMTGCLFITETLPKLKSGDGTLTNNSSGNCAGTVIGNGFTVPTPGTDETLHACNLYFNWPVISVSDAVSRTIELDEDCDMTAPIYVPHNLDLTVSSPAGQRYAIKGAWSNAIFVVGGRLTLSNVELEGRNDAGNFNDFALFAIRSWNPAGISLTDVVVRSYQDLIKWRAGLLLVNAGTVTLTRVTIKGQKTTADDWQASALTVVGENNVKITDSTFSNNQGGVGAIRAHNANSKITFYGTNTFTDNSPKDVFDSYNVVKVYAPSGRGSTSAEDESEKSAPPVNTGAILMQMSGIRVSATYGLTSGVQFQRADAVAVADERVIAMGLLDAVDVWGYVEQGVEVCFPQVGGIVFLDAAFAPRVLAPVEAYSQPGFTCAHLTRPGTVALVSSLPAPQGSDPGEDRTLQRCLVTTPKTIIYFRATPGGQRLQFVDPWGAEISGWLPENVTLTALARTSDWFKVDYYGTQGWVSAGHVTTQGSCA